jgi:membrane carboxypeptidase/penicillin-binding protein
VVGNLDLAEIQEDPFEEDLIVDNRVGGLRKGVVITINEAAPIIGETDDEGELRMSKASATVLISNYEQIEVPFEGGIDWAARFIDEDNQGPKPEKVADVLAVGDVIWLENRDQQWLLADVPRVEGALVSIDPSDGGIQAMVGGFDYFKNKFNRATQARRQPGSAFKPFIYSAALERGFTAASIINDAPVVFDDDSLEATWRPENYSGKFYGPTRLREALVKSRNLVSIRILQSMGLRYATNYVQRFGFEREQMPYDLSLALGSASFSPLQMARAYAVFSNGGYLIEPYIISRVELGNGDVIYQNQPLTVCQGCEDEDLQALAEAEARAAEQQEIESQQASEPQAELQQTEEQAAETTEPVEEEQLETAAADAQEDADGDAESESIFKVVETALEPRYAPRVISAQNAFIMRWFQRPGRDHDLGRLRQSAQDGSARDRKSSCSADVDRFHEARARGAPGKSAGTAARPGHGAHRCGIGRARRSR